MGGTTEYTTTRQCFHWKIAIFAVIYLLLALDLPSSAFADTWLPPRAGTYSSNNGKYVFRVSPTFGKVPKEQFTYGMCWGELYSSADKTAKRIWYRPLLNDYAPVGVCVSNSGRYVVALGEWGHPDRLPVVFYGAHGQLINVYGAVDQIISKSVLSDIPHTVSGSDWLCNALLFFGPDDDHFIIRLKTGDVLLFETETGKLVHQRWKDHDARRKEREREGAIGSTESTGNHEEVKDRLKKLILLEALRLASSNGPEDKEAGLLVLHQHKDRESASILQDALNDRRTRLIDKGDREIREYYIRKAAKKALEAMGVKPPDDLVVEEISKKKQ
jgi:hypothetical protein